MSIVQKAFALAQAILSDPFATKRLLGATPEVLTPELQSKEIDRDRLTPKTIIGFGQVRNKSVIISPALICCSLERCMPQTTEIMTGLLAKSRSSWSRFQHHRQKRRNFYLKSSWWYISIIQMFSRWISDVKFIACIDYLRSLVSVYPASLGSWSLKWWIIATLVWSFVDARNPT